MYQVTLVPKDKFEINHIKLAPHCIVKNKKCLPLEYSPFLNTRIELEPDSNSARQDYLVSQNPNYNHIPLSDVIYLHNYYVSFVLIFFI